MHTVEEAFDMQKRHMKERKGTMSLHCTEFFLRINSIEVKMFQREEVGRFILREWSN